MLLSSGVLRGKKYEKIIDKLERSDVPISYLIEANPIMKRKNHDKAVKALIQIIGQEGLDILFENESNPKNKESSNNDPRKQNETNTRATLESCDACC